MYQSLHVPRLLALPAAIFCICPLAFSQSPYSATVLSDNPVAYYRLGEPSSSTVAVDSSGNGHDGTYEFQPELGVPGLITDPANTAVNFYRGYVTIPDSPQLNFVNAPFTIEAWIDGIYDSTLRRVYDKTQAGNTLGNGFDVSAQSIRLLGDTHLLLYRPFINNKIYYIAGVSDGAGTGTIYVNGQEIGSGPYTSDHLYSGPARLAMASNGTAHFEGELDEVAVYNHQLPPYRILAHFKAGITSINAMPHFLSFPAQPVGTTSNSEFVTLTNFTNNSVVLTSVSTAGDFHNAGNTCGTSIPAGGSCQVAVQFSPTTSGMLTGLLHLQFVPPASNQNIPLSGTGQ